MLEKIEQSDFYKKRVENLERVCELVYNENKEMYQTITQYFRRCVNDYYSIADESFNEHKFPDDIIQKAYIETLRYMSKTK